MSTPEPDLDAYAARLVAEAPPPTSEQIAILKAAWCPVVMAQMGGRKRSAPGDQLDPAP